MKYKVEKSEKKWLLIFTPECEEEMYLLNEIDTRYITKKRAIEVGEEVVKKCIKEGYKKDLSEKIKITKELYEEIKQMEEVEVVTDTVNFGEWQNLNIDAGYTIAYKCKYEYFIFLEASSKRERIIKDNFFKKYNFSKFIEEEMKK